jgi:WD40 repeat protein
MVAVGSFDSMVRVWDATTGKKLQVIRGQQRLEGGPAVGWSADSRRLAIGDGLEIRMVDVATGKTVGCLRGHARSVSSLNWSRDNKLLISQSDDETIRVWDIQTETEVLNITGHRFYEGPVALAWSPDSALIALANEGRPTRDDHTISICNVTTGREMGALGWTSNVGRCPGVVS